MNTYVHKKTYASSLTIQQTLSLNAGETVTGATVSAVTPATPTALGVTLLSADQPLVLTVTAGQLNTTYGVPVTITTNQRVFQIMLAVLNTDDSFNPSAHEDPGSYQDLIDDIDAGKAAIGTAYFQLPANVSARGGYVVWDVLDSQGTVYASGNAFEYTIFESATTSVTARAVVNTPSDIPPTIDDPYQLRYTLRLADGSVAYHYEALRVRGFPDLQVGTQDSIEMQGDLATLSLVTEKLYANYVLEIYQNNKRVASLTCGDPERVARGYFVAGSLDTSALPVSLIPYQVVWKFWNVPAQTYREAAALYVVNASLVQAIEDVKSKVNKARQTLYGTPDSQFPATEIVKWLRRAGDAFNSAYGVLTAFTFTNALGGIREFWLLYAEKFALDAQYLFEAERAFSFNGAAISLDVDRTGMLDSMASKIQSVLDNEVKPFKQNLIIKGITRGDGSNGSGGNGDGSGGMSRAAKGAAVGLLLTPASLYGGYRTYPRR